MEKVTNSSTTHRRTWWCDVCKKQGSHSTDRCFKNPLNVTHQRPDGHAQHSQRPDGHAQHSQHSQRPDGHSQHSQHSQRPDGHSQHSQHSQRPDGHAQHSQHSQHSQPNNKYNYEKKNEKKEEVIEKKDNIKTVTPCVPRPVMTGWAAKASIPIPVKSDDDIMPDVVTSSGFVSLTKDSIGTGVSSKRDMNYRIKPQNNINDYSGDYDEY